MRYEIHRRPRATTTIRSWVCQDGVLRLRATRTMGRRASPLTYDVVLATSRGTFPLGQNAVFLSPFAALREARPLVESLLTALLVVRPCASRVKEPVHVQ